MSASTAGLTLAALPDIQYGAGAPADCVEVFSPPSATANSAVPAEVNPTGDRTTAFYLWARNCDTSTISQFFLNVSPASGGSVKAFLTASPGGLVPDTRCNVSSTPNCTFGQVKPGEVVQVIVVVQASTTTGPFGVTFTWTTTGNGHGDNFPWYDSVNVSTSADYAGVFTYSSNPTPGSFTIANTKINVLGGTGGNQSTSATVATQNIPVTVRDGADWTPPATTICDSDPANPVSGVPCPTGLFGEWSTVDVDNGQGTSVTIVITIDGSQVENGTNANSLVVYHYYLDGTTLETEIIDSSCGTAPCRDVSISRGKNPVWTITIQTDHNGSIRLF